MDLGLFKPQYKEKVAYLRQCGKYRVNTTKYVVYGQLLDLVLPSEEIETFTDNGFGWGLYEKQRIAKVPAAEARLWKAEDGSLAIFFANYLDKEVSFPFTFKPSEYGLEGDTWKISEVGIKSTKKIGEFEGMLSGSETLAPGKIKVIEFTPL